MVQDNTIYKSLNNVEQFNLDKTANRKIYFNINLLAIISSVACRK